MEAVYRLVISCPDQVGIVAKVGQFIADYHGWIVEASHHTDPELNWFFMRHCIRASSLSVSLDEFKQAFQHLADEFSMQWHISDSRTAKKMVLMASKESHCLMDILHRWHSQELFCDIPCVISNHADLQEMVTWYGIPFFHVPIDPQNKPAHFRQVTEIIQQQQADLVVLARYMQILPDVLCHNMSGQIINIHHSFLPSFVGAKPYHQAAKRGVKLIGATCHYVTKDLDEGPIIDQDVVRISHKDSLDDLVRLGKDVEKLVLARGVRSHLQDRVILHDNKTLVF